MEASTAESSGSGSNVEYMAGVRLVVLNLPEDEGEGLGFRLTRTLWDPYPWVREITPGARADVAGLKTGDCLLQADGKDLLGLPIGQVAGLIRGDGSGHGVSLLVWNCGVDPKDDPELLWSCGGGVRGERSRRALAGVVRALACCVCAATATRALSCARSHLYCEGCWSRLERCALCREPLPAKDSPYARNLVAEQVFEAIATEYEIKDAIKRPTESVSAYTTPNRSPNMSPSTNRRGQYQLSMMNKKKTVQFSDKLGQSYGSDPNLHRSISGEFIRRTPSYIKTSNSISQARNINTNGGKTCNCQKNNQMIQNSDVPQIKVEYADKVNENTNCAINCQNMMMQHKIVARLRQACSLVDLQNSTAQTCSLSGSLNNIRLDDHCSASHSNSLENLKNSSGCDTPVFVLSAPPVYLLACEHSK